MLQDKLHIILQHIVPHHLLSRLIGKLANCRWRWWKNLFIKTFIKVYDVDMREAVETDPTKYNNFNDFFTRALKPELRPIASNKYEIASPVDGFLSEIGQITNDKIIQAKNFFYSLTALLGGFTTLAQSFHQGEFATLYLAPKNYHRIHMPLTGVLQEMIYVPGHLFSVNQNTVKHVSNLFARNERVIAIFNTEAGRMAVILVGAMIVASIETVWGGVIAPSNHKKIQTWQYPANQVVLNKGEELGRFKLGSTVIVLMQKGRVSWDDFKSADPIKMGQLLGVMCH